MSRPPPIPRHALIVHPDPLVRGTVMSVASMLGMGRVAEADGAFAGQRLLQGGRFDAVVLDLSEGRPALQLLAGLRAGEYCSPRNTPVLVTCAVGSADVTEELEQFAPAELISQPFRVKSLLLKIQALAAKPVRIRSQLQASRGFSVFDESLVRVAPEL